MRHLLHTALIPAALAAGCLGGAATLPASVEVLRPTGAATASVPPGTAVNAVPLLGAGGGRPGTGYVGAAAQLLLPSGDDAESGWGLDVNYTHNVSEQLSVELSLGLLRFDLEGGAPADELRTVAMGAAAQVGRQQGSARWYAGAGLGWWLNDLSGSGAASSRAENGLAAAVSGGADLAFGAQMNVCLELRYVLSSADLSAGGEIDLDAFAVRANCVFLF